MVRLLSAEAVCGTMKRPSLPARRPSAGARPWPVSVLLRGWDSPASFV